MNEGRKTAIKYAARALPEENCFFRQFFLFRVVPFRPFFLGLVEGAAEAVSERRTGSMKT